MKEKCCRLMAAPLALVLAALLCACSFLLPQTPESVEQGYMWELSARATRGAQLRLQGFALNFEFTLDFVFFKKGGVTAEGVFEGQILLGVDSYLTDPQRAGEALTGQEGYQLERRAWAVSQPILLTFGPPDDAVRKTMQAAAEGYDAELSGQLASAFENGFELAEVDDFGEALPAPAAAVTGACAWQSDVVFVEWRTEQAGYSGEVFWQQAGAFMEAVGFPRAQMGEDYSPNWQGSFPESPENKNGGVCPLMVTVGDEEEVRIWLPGLLPLDGERPFEGRLLSGTSVSVSTPMLPAEARYPDGSSGVESVPVSQPASQPKTPNGDGEEGEDGKENEEEKDEETLAHEAALAAMDELGLPAPPFGLWSGPMEEASTQKFTTSECSYADAKAYARRLKKSGFSTVMNEVDRPSMDVYSLVATSKLGVQLSLYYREGDLSLVRF